MGVKLLAEDYYPAQVLLTSVPVTKLADIKGKKIRESSAEQGELVMRLGTVPVTLALPEVATALQSGGFYR